MMARRCLLLAVAIAALPLGSVRAQVGPQGPGMSLKQGPEELLDKIEIAQKLDEPLPVDLQLQDEEGRAVRLGDYFGDKPVIFALVYYECPMLCTMVLNGALRAVNVIKELSVGKDYDIVAVSIDHREPYQLAADKKKEYASRYPRPGSKDGWHFLVADEAAVQRLADAVGFRFYYDEETDQFAHGSAIMVVTPDARLSKYFYGIDYDPRSLRLALVEASAGGIGSLVDAVILYCFKYNPLEGKYSLAIMNVLRALAVVTALVLFGFMGISALRDRSRSSTEVPS
jgi:protein SCO1/2